MEYQSDYEEPWQGLTDEEIVSCNQTVSADGTPCVFLYRDDLREGGIQFARAIEAKLREKNADYGCRPIYMAEVTMPDPDEIGPWCDGTASCLNCGHEWIAVWPLGAESLECPDCGSTDTDRDQAGPHTLKTR